MTPRRSTSVGQEIKPPRVRARVDADIDRCARLVDVVHVCDGYPAYLPDDVLRFVASHDAYAAWVAEAGGRIVGHVALHSRGAREVMALVREAIGIDDRAVAVVARLLVSPTARRQGIGRALLATATGDATARGLRPIVDVATHYKPAIELYEAAGWIRIGTATLQLPDGASLDEFVYLGPEPARRSDV
jgi:GNAT superfamily N-acetyltransferase